MRHLAVGLAAVVLVAAGTLVLSTVAQTNEEVQSKPKKPAVSQTNAKPRESSSADEEPLNKTVRLKFTLTNDDGDHSFPVLCAARTFLIEHDVSEVDGGQQIKIAGQLRNVDKNDRVFIAFNLMHYHSNDTESFDATFKLSGSAVLQFGKKVEAGMLGDQKVSITATLVE